MRRLSLAAVRVLDLDTAWAGAYCARLLGDAGAEVIRVEPVVRRHAPDEGRLYLHLNRNKLGCTLDISHQRGRDLLLRLAAKSNVVVESLTAGDRGRLGLTHEAFQAARPDVIVAAVSGPEGETVITVDDVIIGTAAVGAVAAALLQHRHTGAGLRVERNAHNLVADFRDEFLSAFSAAETPPPVLPPPDDPHLRQRHLFERVSHPDGRIEEMAGLPWRFSETPAHVRLPAPRCGEHNSYVFGDLLGLSLEEMEELQREGIVGRVDA